MSTTTSHGSPDADGPDPDDHEAASAADRGPETATLRQRLDRLRLVARRQRWGRLTLVALAALVVGLWIGRSSAAGPGPEVRQAVEASVLPIAADADAIWTAGADGRPAVTEGLVALRSDGDVDIIEQQLIAWVDAYDQALVRIAGVDLPSTARPVQRQFITAVTLSRDAVEVLGHAASVEDPVHRRDLATEVARLRSRSEQLMQSARASTADLDGRRTDVAPLPALLGFLEGRVG